MEMANGPLHYRFTEAGTSSALVAMAPRVRSISYPGDVTRARVEEQQAGMPPPPLPAGASGSGYGLGADASFGGVRRHHEEAVAADGQVWGRPWA